MVRITAFPPPRHGVAATALLAVSLSMASCSKPTDESITQQLVGTWECYPRLGTRDGERLPPEKIENTGWYTPNMEAIHFLAGGKYVHVRTEPGEFAPNPGFERWLEWDGSWSVVGGRLGMTSSRGGEVARQRSGEHWKMSPGGEPEERDQAVLEIGKHQLKLDTSGAISLGGGCTFQRSNELPARPWPAP